MALNKTQIDYAFSRIDAALKAQQAKVTARHTTPAAVLSGERRASLIHEGAVLLRRDVSTLDSYSRVFDVFDFSAFGWPEKIDTAAVRAEMAPFEADAQAIKDQLVLGDSEAALRAIAEFSAKCAK